jgi:hypothetical protein
MYKVVRMRLNGDQPMVAVYEVSEKENIDYPTYANVTTYDSFEALPQWIREAVAVLDALPVNTPIAGCGVRRDYYREASGGAQRYTYTLEEALPCGTE